MKLKIKTSQLVVLFALGFSLVGFAQSARSHNNKGVDNYNDKKYSDAEVSFRKAADKDTSSYIPHFNLGDAYYRQNNYEKAIASYSDAIEKTKDNSVKAKSLYNIGNSYLKEQKYQESVNAYKESLKLNPNDADAKYNLSYALQKMKEKNKDNKDQNKDKNQDKNKDQNKDKNQDKNKNQNKDKNQDKNKDQNKDQNQDKNKDQNKDKNQQQQNDAKISKQEAEKILNAMKNNEQDLQKKLRVKQGTKVKTEKDW